MTRIILAILVLTFSLETTAASEPLRPRLILQITVDGLRGDLLDRYRPGFGDGGFARLLDQGTVYKNAHHDHANTETIVGHATLATGAHPADHGMVGNAWLDATTGELGYNIEDADFPLLRVRETATAGEQVDPAQRAARSDGRSPRNLIGTTFGDELGVHFGGRSKVFAVSGKDRGAVPMAGHGGTAYWFSTDTGDMVTSTYYHDAYPNWVASWNAERRADQLAGTAWELLDDPDTYVMGHRDDRPYEVDLRGYGRTFPHPFGTPDDGLFYTRVLVGPAGDRLTADFAARLLVAEELGADDIPDYLAVSFSGPDAVNHFFGPSSLENEDVVRQLDRTLAAFLAAVDEAVGLEATLIVLSSDHGMAEVAEFMAEQGVPAGRLEPATVIAAADAAARDRFGLEQVTRQFFRPYLYLDHAAIAAAGLDADEVGEVVADALDGVDGVGMAVPWTLQRQMSGRGSLGRVQNNFHVARSGDVYVAQAPYWFLLDSGPIAVMHGSPWRYDTHVPIIVAGMGIPAETVHRPVRTVDLAVTLSALLGVKQPSHARGAPLVEAWR